MSANELLVVEDLTKHFPVTRGIIFQKEIATVKAVDGISFTLREGETLGIVGESGCGKSTLVRCLLKLLEPTSGRIIYEGRDISGLSRREMRPLRRNMMMVFQDPYASLNARKRVGFIIGEALELHGIGTPAERKRRVQELLEVVGLNPEHFNRFPHEFSGGQRQRIGVARALAVNPKLIFCDEPVSALDVSVQAQILNLLKDLQREFGLTYVFIAHDLNVVRHISDRVMVMYLGKAAELANRDEHLREPEAPVHRGPALRGAAAEPGRRPRAKEARARGRRAEPDQSSVGVQLPPAVPALPRGPLRRGDASARTGRARPPRRVPLPARALADGHLGAARGAVAAGRDDRVALPCRRTLGRRCFPPRAGSSSSRAWPSSSRPAAQHSSASHSEGLPHDRPRRGSISSAASSSCWACSTAFAGRSDRREATKTHEPIGGILGFGIFSGGIRAASADERADARATTWLFLALGIAMFVVGAIVDPRTDLL